MHNVTRLIKDLYRKYNGRDIKLVADYELEFGLLTEDSNLLDFIKVVYNEVYLLSELKLPKIESLADTIQVSKSRGYSEFWDANRADFLEELLIDLACTRLAKGRILVDSISSDAPKANVIDDDYISQLLTTHDLPVPSGLPGSLKEVFSEGVGLHEDLLFKEYNLESVQLEELSKLCVALSDEYSQRWDLALYRFDCLLAVFITNCTVNQSVGALLRCIYHWKNSVRFRPLCIYDLYGADRSLLKVVKAGTNVDVSRIKKIYQQYAQCEEDVELDCFIKNIVIPEPPDRGGTLPMDTTKGILRNVYKGSNKNRKKSG